MEGGLSRCAEKSRIEKCFKKCVERCAEGRADRQEGCAEACKDAAARVLARLMAGKVLTRALDVAAEWLLKRGVDLLFVQAIAIAYGSIVADWRRKLPQDCTTRELHASAAAIAAVMLAKTVGRRELRLLAALAAWMLQGCEEGLERLFDAMQRLGFSEEELARIGAALEEGALAVAGVAVRL